MAYTIAPSARKHGVADEDMLHALRNVIRVGAPEDGFTMLVGPARDGTMLEVGVAQGKRRSVIIHADRARPKLLPRKGYR